MCEGGILKRHIKLTCLVTQIFVLMFLMSVFVLPARSADNNNCTIKGTVSFSGVPDWGLNSQQFWFSQVDPVNSTYSGGDLQLEILMVLAPGVITTKPLTWSEGDSQKFLADMVDNIELNRNVNIYSNTSGFSANHALVATVSDIKTLFKDILNGGNGLSVPLTNLSLRVAPQYYRDGVQNYTYRFAIRQNTTAISNLKQDVTKDYPLDSVYCTGSSGKIENQYSLTSTYMLGNTLPNMIFEQRLGGAATNVDTYTFRTVVDFIRELNVNIAATPDSIDFGFIPNTKGASVQRDIDITFNGLPPKSSVTVDYVFTGIPSWVKASILESPTQEVTNEIITINSGDRITRTLKIESPQAQTGDVDGQLIINAALN